MHGRTHLNCKHKCTTELLRDCYHCVDPCEWESWEMSWNGIGGVWGVFLLQSSKQSIFYLISIYICLLSSSILSSRHMGPVYWTEKYFWSFLINRERRINKDCIYLASIHQSISARAPPEVPTVFPWTERKRGQKFGDRRPARSPQSVSQLWDESLEPDA